MKITKPKDLLKIKGSWYHKQFHAYPLTLGSIATGAVQFAHKFLAYTMPFGICFYTKSIADWYWAREHQMDVRKKVIEAQLKNPNFITKVNSARHSEFIKLKKALNKFYLTDLKKLDNGQLWNAYNDVLIPLYRQWGWGMVSEPFLESEDDWFADELKDDLVKIFGRDWIGILPVIGLPDKQSFVNAEYNSILRLAIVLEREKSIIKSFKTGGLDKALSVVGKNKKLHRMLSTHSDSFFWVEDNYSVWRHYGEKYFLKKALRLALDHPVKALKVENSRFINQLKKKRIYLRKMSSRSKKLVILANVLSESSDERKTSSFRSARVWFSLAQEVARRGHLTQKEVLHMTDLELKKYLLTGVVNRNLLRERQNQCLLIHLPTKNLIFSGKDLQKVKPADFEEIKSFQNIIKGVCASPGISIGKVRIVIKHNEIGQVKKGEILVTNNTTPDYVPAMRKAAAIVTEQGGITSHAALVSRELGVPCVIGTKIATRFLKTGDRVEVDANKGIVRKL